MKKLMPGNIWSGSETLAVFTCPTELAFRKGNLKGHYPLLCGKTTYPDAEALYQYLKRDGEWKSDEQLEALMIWVLMLKFLTYPRVILAIQDNGGLEWIEKCSHHVNGNLNWEGDGLNSRFIKCLYEAYKRIAAI